MSLSEQVAKLEEEKASLKAGWRNDVEILLSLAQRHGEGRIAEAAKVCLRRL